MVNGTLLNFGKRYEDIFDQWPKLLLGLDALSNKKILKGVYYIGTYLVIFLVSRQSELRHSMMHSSEPHSVYKTILNCSIKWQRLYKYNMHIFRRLQMQIFCHIHTSQTFKLKRFWFLYKEQSSLKVRFPHSAIPYSLLKNLF